MVYSEYNKKKLFTLYESNQSHIYVLILVYLTILFIHSSIPKFGDENVLMHYYVL